MSKQKITDVTGNEVFVKVPEVVSATPLGSQVLVELLTPQEILGTGLYVGEGTKTLNGAPQAYVLALGPMVDPKWGLVAGQRIVVSGSFTPLPEVVSKNGRPVATLDPHMCKAVLEEKKH